MTAVSESEGRNRKAKEAAILDAAEAVFSRAGLGGATMAGIAAEAGVPKANLHYYFGTKEELYRAVLARILDLWLDAHEEIRADRPPAEAIAGFIRRKMALSLQRPDASRVFANEMIHGAAHGGDYLRARLVPYIETKVAVLRGWIAEGRITPVDPHHFFFRLWAMTQTYADFDVQICTILGRERLSDGDIAHAADEMVSATLRGLGLAP